MVDMISVEKGVLVKERRANGDNAYTLELSMKMCEMDSSIAPKQSSPGLRGVSRAPEIGTQKRLPKSK